MFQQRFCFVFQLLALFSVAMGWSCQGTIQPAGWQATKVQTTAFEKEVIVAIEHFDGQNPSSTHRQDMLLKFEDDTVVFPRPTGTVYVDFSPPMVVMADTFNGEIKVADSAKGKTGIRLVVDKKDVGDEPVFFEAFDADEDLTKYTPFWWIDASDGDRVYLAYKPTGDGTDMKVGTAAYNETTLKAIPSENVDQAVLAGIASVHDVFGEAKIARVSPSNTQCSGLSAFHFSSNSIGSGGFLNDAQMPDRRRNVFYSIASSNRLAQVKWTDGMFKVTTTSFDLPSDDTLNLAASATPGPRASYFVFAMLAIVFCIFL